MTEGADADTLTCISWGEMIDMTRGFLTTYADEAPRPCQGLRDRGLRWVLSLGFRPEFLLPKAVQTRHRSGRLDPRLPAVRFVLHRIPGFCGMRLRRYGVYGRGVH